MSFQRTYLLFAALIVGLSGTPARAQISIQAVPYGFRSTVIADAPTHRLPPATAKVDQVTLPWDNAGFSIIPPAAPEAAAAVDLGFENAGQWHALSDGGRLWRLRITSPEAASLHLVYDDFWMPPGAQLFLYDDARRVVLGAFTERNNKPHSGFATDAVPGGAVTLEYYEPAGVAPGRLHIETVVQRLSDASGPSVSSGPYVPRALSCSINVACSEGDGWDDAINATVKISNGCTGVLLNNTREDGMPYVLTANHCGSPAVGDTLNWVFQFNYQSSTCADPAETPSYQSVSGAVVRAADGYFLSDFTLMELLEPIPESYNAHFAGWSIEDAAPTMGVVVGHPRQDIKKIAVEDDPVQHYGSTHWRAVIDHGVIQSGSSGSPLFNENHQFVGHVRASMSLDDTACSGPGGDDNAPDILFPKLSYNWDRGDPGERISDFLDPDGTGSTSVPALGPPSPIWVNEVNAHAGGVSGAATQDDEFVEVVGPPGTNLDGYELEVYACSGGTATLQSTQTLGSFTLQNEYGSFGVFVIAGPSGTLPNVDQVFGGAGTDVLPDGSGLLILKNSAGQSLFDYQYDSQSGGVPDQCPQERTTRSEGDAPGSDTMGFTTNDRPSSGALATSSLTSTPGEQNWDGGQQLPVELVAFDARLDGPAVELLWETASETNNAGFEIQRSGEASAKPENGETHWEVLGFVEGHGTTEEVRYYEYRIDAMPPGRYRFRLKQVDYDGTFAYSPEVEVAVGLPTAFHLAPAYPNPFNPETSFSLSVARPQQVEVAVYNVMGQRVAQLYAGPFEAERTRSFVLRADGLPSGLYVIRALGESFVTSQTVTLLK